MAADDDSRADPPRILLLGARGQVGFELVRALRGLGAIDAPGREELDLARADRLESAVCARRPTIIVNAAAYTDVERAESEPHAARAINSVAPRIVARAARSLDALLVHYSTDFVFDGAATRPYMESDPTRPLSVYGQSKRDGEHAVLDSGARALVFRTSWVYGLRRRSFLLTVRRLVREQAAVRIVADQWGSPTWCASIADATARIVGMCCERAPPWTERRLGLYHMSAGGSTTWHGFARAIVDSDPGLEQWRDTPIEAITSEQYPSAARRPRFSVLDNQRLRESFGIALDDWRQQLSRALGL